MSYFNPMALIGGGVVSGDPFFPLNSFVYSGDSEDLSAKVTSAPKGLFFKQDGTEFYVSEQFGANIYQYSLSTEWDITTLSYTGEVDISLTTAETLGIFIGSSGTKLYVTNKTDTTVDQYTLSPAWDISTASYDSKALSVSSEDTSPLSISFSNDGLICYLVGNTTDEIYQYVLTIAWDISTASYDSKSTPVDETPVPRDIHFTQEGLTFYIPDQSSNNCYQYNLSSAWDVSTASYSGKTLQTTEEMNNPQGVYSSNDNKFFFAVSQAKVLYKYSSS